MSESRVPEPSPTQGHITLHCSKGVVEARVGDEFLDDHRGGGRWRIEAFTVDRIYSPSGLGGTPIVRCRPLSEVAPYWSEYIGPDGTVEWCGDSVGAALATTRAARLAQSSEASQ